MRTANRCCADNGHGDRNHPDSRQGDEVVGVSTCGHSSKDGARSEKDNEKCTKAFCQERSPRRRGETMQGILVGSVASSS